MGWIGVLLIGTYFLLEGRLRQGQEARSLEPTPHDRWTTWLSGVAFGIAVVGAPLVAGYMPIDRPAVGVGGLAMMVVGLGLRWWAAVSLGRHYTRTLRILDHHRLVDTGPYRVVRHPGYLAVMALWTGYGLAWLSLASIAVAALPVIVLYVCRVLLEERMLSAALPEYREYRRRTWRILPPVW